MRKDYGPLDRTARRLIEQFGKDAVLITAGTASGPAWDPQPGEPTLTPITVVQEDVSLMYRNETLIGDEDLVLYAASTVEITQRDKLAVDGFRYEIAQINRVAPGPTLLLYRILARGPGEPYVMYEPGVFEDGVFV